MRLKKPDGKSFRFKGTARKNLRSSAEVIEFVGVEKTYGNGTRALRDVNIRIETGEFVFIVGSSGAGKSTLLKLIMCEEKPTSGSVFINGHDLSAIKRREIPMLRRSMGVVFQDFRLIPSMTVYDNVAFALRVTNASVREIRRKVPKIIGLMGLGQKLNAYPNELSGGEQQRVALARALVNNPSLIIADEPTGNIDPELSFEILELLDEINKLGATVIMVTHELGLVEQFQKRVISIENGQVAYDRPGEPAWEAGAAADAEMGGGEDEVE